MRGTFLERSIDFDNKILWFAYVTQHYDTQHYIFHGDLPYTTKQFTTNLTDVTSNKFRASLLKDLIYPKNKFKIQ